jgi:hypothetical protein
VRAGARQCRGTCTHARLGRAARTRFAPCEAMAAPLWLAAATTRLCLFALDQEFRNQAIRRWLRLITARAYARTTSGTYATKVSPIHTGTYGRPTGLFDGRLMRYWLPGRSVRFLGWQLVARACTTLWCVRAALSICSFVMQHLFPYQTSMVTRANCAG